MALPPDLSAATRVLAKTPIHDLPCMKVIQVWAAACFDFQVSKLIPYMRRTARSRKTMGEHISITRDIALFCVAFHTYGRGFDVSFTLGPQVVKLLEGAGLVFKFHFGKRPSRHRPIPL